MSIENFPINALDDAARRIVGTIDSARESVENLVQITNKTYMNFVRPLMDINAEIWNVFCPVNHLHSVNNSNQTKEIIDAVLPVMSEFDSDMARHRGVYDGFLFIKKHEYNNLDVAQKRVIDRAIEDFELSGIALPAAEQARLKELAAALSKFGNDFANNVIAANQKFKLKITDESDLGDMPKSDRMVARVDDGWEFSLLDTDFISVMDYVTRREIREKMYQEYANRAPENEEIILQMLKLRAEEAKILGFENYAEFALKTRSAPSPAAVQDFLNTLLSAAKPFADRDYKRLIQRAAADGIDLKPWDANFYLRILKKETCDLDESETKPYFESNATVHGMFGILKDMFGLEFSERCIPLWHPCARFYDVKKDGKIIAGFYMDLETRGSKSAGAWMDSFRVHYRDANGVEFIPQVFNVGNFPVASNSEPALLSLADVSTMFHEMGHALHSILSTVDEFDISGTNVDTDVVELPSQFFEAFWNCPVVLKRIGRHYQTGEQIPDELIKKIIDFDKFDGGMHITTLCERSLFDMKIHCANNLSADDIRSIHSEATRRSPTIEIPKYLRHPHIFLHSFSHGYAAGYYSYLWANVMAADAYMAFEGSPFRPELAQKYMDTVLAQGGTKNMGEIYREFLGRDPNPESLIKLYGLK